MLTYSLIRKLKKKPIVYITYKYKSEERRGNELLIIYNSFSLCHTVSVFNVCVCARVCV